MRKIKTASIIITFTIMVCIVVALVISSESNTAYADEERSTTIVSNETTTQIETTTSIIIEPTTIIQTTTQPPTVSSSLRADLLSLVEPNISSHYSQITELYNLINEARRNSGLSDLILSPQLNKVSTYRALEMAENENGTSQVSHTRPNGMSFSSVAREFGVGYNMIGENICDILSDSNSVNSAFYNSDSHRNNMLGDFTYVGIGIAVANNGVYYWVETFTR